MQMSNCWGCDEPIPELVITEDNKYIFKCTNCGCATKEKDNIFAAQIAWNKGDVYAPDDFWGRLRRGEL